MQGTAITLTENAGAGNGTALTYVGGRSVVVARGTWGGGNVKLQIMLADNVWADVANSTLSANGITAALDLPAGTYRAVVTTSTAVYAKLCRIPV